MPRPSVYYQHSVQPSPLLRSSDDDDPGSRSPPLEVSDEECMRDHISSTTGVEHGEEPLIFSRQSSAVKREHSGSQTEVLYTVQKEEPVGSV